MADVEKSALREIRLFVSSTFRDLELEREKLVLDAFPRLRRECVDRGVAFTEIDLRWGITDEEARVYQVLQICLEEVERCANFPPFFIGILGNRYGWIPDAIDWSLARNLETIFPGFSDRHQGQSITELEIQFGVLEREDMRPNAFFYFLALDGPSDPKQENLKKLIRASGVRFREGIATPDELSGYIVQDMTAEIENRFPKHTRPSRLDQITEAQDIHSKSLSTSYIPSPGIFDTWLTNIEYHKKICLYGDSGTGKSAFLASFGQEARDRLHNTFVFAHHVGVGDSRTRHTWMACLFNWAYKCGISEIELPKSNSEIQALLPTLLCALESSGHVLIILDAVDQLYDGQNIDEWLPVTLGSNLCWVISTTDPQQMITCRQLGWHILELPPLDAKRARDLICNGLGRYRKRLPIELLDRCLTHAMATRPLFLKVLYEELRQYGNHETLEVHLISLLACKSIEELFICMLKRFRTGLGNQSIEVLSLIGLSRHGASEPELRSSLSLRTWDVRRVVLMASPYLSSHQGLLSPFHDGFRRALTSFSQSTNLRDTWCAYWKQSLDMERRFDEYPGALGNIGAWEDICKWIFAADTLAFAIDNSKVDILVGWYVQVSPKVPELTVPSNADIKNWSLTALLGLKEFAYQIGNLDLEMMALMAQRGMVELNECNWLLELSRLHYRRSQQTVATELAYQAIESAKTARESLDSKMNLIQMLAFGDSPEQALEVSQQIFQESTEILQSDIEAEAYLCQYTSFACHFLDFNKQSYDYSIRAADLYGALGRRYDQGISWVNAGDGAWGFGNFVEAERCFLKALSLATATRLPHVEDIAKICLANLRMSESKFEEAAQLYDQGILLATTIGQDWDALYGKIYQALTLGLQGKSHADLKSLALEAERYGYSYLSDVAKAHRLVLNEGDGNDWEMLSKSKFPGPRAYALASGMLFGHDMKEDLGRIIETTEGIKGPLDFIKRPLDAAVKDS